VAVSREQIFPGADEPPNAFKLFADFERAAFAAIGVKFRMPGLLTGPFAGGAGHRQTE
jgi:hypothetical protein